MKQRNDAPAVNASLVRRLVADQFPQWANLGVSPVEEDGHDNSMFHLSDELGLRQHRRG